MKAEKRCPLKHYDQDMLNHFSHWSVDPQTGEAVVWCYKSRDDDTIVETIRVFDEISLINLSARDLIWLAAYKCRFEWKDWEPNLARMYNRVATVSCIYKEDNAGNLPPQPPYSRD